MISFKKVTIILSFVLSVNFVVCGQNNNIRFKHLTVDNGLSQNWVKAICQDNFGFLWFGTGGNGINRYDGYYFKIYKNNPKNIYTLSNNWINSIYLDRKKRLWVGTQSGFNLYDNEKDRFIRFPALRTDVIIDFVETDDGKLYVVTVSNIYEIDAENKSVTPFCTGYENCFNFILIGSIIKDKMGNYWMCSSQGLLQLDFKNKTFVIFNNDKDDPHSLSTNNIRCVYPDSKGRVWVGTVDNGLNLIKYKNNEPDKPYFVKLTHDPKNPNSIGKGNVWTIMDDNNGRLWISILNESLDVLDLTGLEKGDTIFTHYKNNPFDENSISNVSVNAFYKDKQGTIWIGNYNGGVDYYNKLHYKFGHIKQVPNIKNSLNNNFVNVFLEDSDNLWVGTESGINILNRKTGSYKQLVHDPDNILSVGSNAIWALCKDKKNNIWVGTWDGGLNLYNRKNNTFKHFYNDIDNPKSLSNNNIFGITEDDDGYLWIATMGGGLNKYDYKTNDFTVYRATYNNTNNLSGNWIHMVLKSENHEFWIASTDAVDLFNNKTGVFTKFINDSTNSKTINYNGANVIFEDSRKNVWLGTDGGLNLFIRKDSSFFHYSEDNGLPNNSIKAICEDSHGNLWLSTNNGISEFINGVNNPFHPVFKNYNKSDGLQDNEFNRRSSYKDKNGILYFGGIKGFNFFHPDSLKENNYIPDIFITEFLHFNKPIDIGEGSSILKQNICSTRELVLKYDISVIGFRFAALNYISPEKNQYAYMLEGFESNWNNVGNKREVTYTNLNPGTYIFRVKASNNDGHWNEKGVSLKITILPPWWATIWFRVIAILSIIGLIMYYIYTRTHKLQFQKNVLEDKVKERTGELSEVTVLLEEKQQEILTQNEELRIHREKLEQMVTDRTSALKNALKKAEESDKLKTAFLANMSHEIRTPMNSIVGFSTLLSAPEFSDLEKDHFVTIIQNNCNSLQVLIDDIIEISLIESNQLTINKNKVDIISILKELESFYKLKNEKDISIGLVSNNYTDFWLNTDPVRFRQIISNLINNAIKYTERGFVKFGFDIVEDNVRFYISDSGIGIPKEEFDNVFTHFYKIESDNTKLYRGAGIGLAICKKLVNLLGGDIWLESQINKGTTFFFTLPDDKIGNKQLVPGKKEESTRLKKLDALNVLVAEDEENNYFLLKRLLESHGAKVTWAKNGKEAIKLTLENKKPDLVLMDIKMPMMNGADATKLIRDKYPDLPIIAITAYSLPTEKRRYMAAGFTDYITKPIDVKDFIDLVKKWV